MRSWPVRITIAYTRLLLAALGMVGAVDLCRPGYAGPPIGGALVVVASLALLVVVEYLLRVSAATRRATARTGAANHLRPAGQARG